MIYIAARLKRLMKRPLMEKGFVIILFVLVMVAFSFAQRDTRKALEKYDTENTVDISKKTIDYTAEASQTTTTAIKATRN